MRSEGEFAAMHVNSESSPVEGGAEWRITTARFNQDEIALLGIEYWRGGDFLLYVPFWIPVSLMTGLLLWKFTRLRPRRLLSHGFTVESGSVV